MEPGPGAFGKFTTCFSPQMRFEGINVTFVASSITGEDGEKMFQPTFYDMLMLSGGK